MRKLFLLIMLMIALQATITLAVLQCLELEQSNDKVYARCYEIKQNQYNTTQPKINITLPEELEISTNHMKVIRLGDLDFDITEMDESDFFQDFTNSGYSTYDLEDITGNSESSNGDTDLQKIYQPIGVLSDGFYVFKLEGSNEQKVFLDISVFFEINASQINMWVHEPITHNIEKPLFAASSIPKNNFTIELEKEAEGCRYSHTTLSPTKTLEQSYEGAGMSQFKNISKTIFTIENFTYDNDLFPFLSNNPHSFQRMEIICKEEAGADARYSYKRLYFTYLPNPPIITQTQAIPETVLDSLEATINITTHQTTVCTISVPALPSDLSGNNPVPTYGPSYLFDQLTYYNKNKQDKLTVSMQPSPYEFSLNITCTNLANKSTSKIQKIKTDFTQSIDFAFITPPSYINTKTVNLSGAYNLLNEVCIAKFNEEETQTTLDQIGLIASGTHAGRDLHQKTITVNALKEGTNQAKVHCGGMAPGTYKTRNFVLDTKPPTNMTIKTTDNSCSLTSIRAQLNADDDNGIDYYEYVLEYQGTKEGDFDREGTTQGQLTINFNSNQASILENETFKLKARAIDLAGNPGSFVERTIKMTPSTIIACDFISPQIKIEPNYNPTQKNWNINVSCTDNRGCASSFVWGVNTNKSATCETTNQQTLGQLIPIQYEAKFCAEVSDLNNNKASKTILLEKQTAPPSACQGICGGDCPLCPVGESCTDNSVCASNYCSEGICTQPSCEDLKQNGHETDVDCGGPNCPPCGQGLACITNSDCESRSCEDNICVEATCDDGKVSGTQTDKDCGGPDCLPCSIGSSCERDSDCLTSYCFNGRCAEKPTDLTQEEKSSVLGVILLITGIMLIIAGATLLYFESEKKKQKPKIDTSTLKSEKLDLPIKEKKAEEKKEQLKIKNLATINKQENVKEPRKETKRKDILGEFEQTEISKKPELEEQKSKKTEPVQEKETEKEKEQKSKKEPETEDTEEYIDLEKLKEKSKPKESDKDFFNKLKKISEQKK